MFKYFLLYEGNGTIRNIQATRTKPISDITDVREIEAELTDRQGHPVTVRGWQELRKVGSESLLPQRIEPGYQD